MCDIVPGQLIVCQHKKDFAADRLIEKIKRGEIGHVDYLESLTHKLERLGEKLFSKMDFSFHLIRVPEGQEVWKLNYLQFYYKHEMLEVLSDSSLWEDYSQVLSYSNHHFWLDFNHVLTLSTGSAPAAAFENFQFTDVHEKYKSLIGIVSPDAASGSCCRIKVLDTGISPRSDFKIIKRINLTDLANADDVSDDDPSQHGTVVCSIITDIAPNAELLVYKVADKDEKIVEWDALAGLCIADDCDIINLSMQFGLADMDCPYCGRASFNSRSRVFETVISLFAMENPGHIVVAAAGNQGEKGMRYPARFGNVLAAASINSSRSLSSFSNYGALDEADDPHPNLFLLPGGEKNGASLINNEYVMVGNRTASGHWGTSCAAAYASGAIAYLKGMPQFRNSSRSALLDYLKQTARKDFPGYDPQLHGNGILTIPFALSSPGVFFEETTK